jgi:hypothetical protein
MPEARVIPEMSQRMNGMHRGSPPKNDSPRRHGEEKNEDGGKMQNGKGLP